MSPKVSVLMPVYNDENFVSYAIKSILNQTLEDFEFIIIDGGSQDDSQQLIKSFEDRRMKFIEHERRFGFVDSLNEGLKIASGNLIARQDADDFSHKKRLEIQRKAFQENRNLTVLGSSIFLIKEDKIRKKENKKRITLEDFRLGNPIAHGSVMFKKNTILKEGGYLRNLKGCEDVELWMRLAKKGYKIENLQEPLYYHRIHSGQITNSLKPTEILLREIIRELHFGNLNRDIMKKMVSEGHFKEIYSLLSAKRKMKFHVRISDKEKKKGNFMGFLQELSKAIKKDPFNFLTTGRKLL